MFEKNIQEKKEIQEVTGVRHSQSKKHFTEPKLMFIKPRLIKHGDATKITAGFFGSFSPGP